VVARLGLGDRLAHRPSEMSGGQQQRVAAARALVSRPEVVFADEPAGNLDQRAGGELLELLAWMVREASQTIVMVTHDPGAAGHTDRAVFLVDGHLVGDIDQPTTGDVSDKIKELES
jgi:putative ABC transport system ATP-binding protein